jgi:CDP-L-myo-inositol myo-inositolphosphotransferase
MDARAEDPGSVPVAVSLGRRSEPVAATSETHPRPRIGVILAAGRSERLSSVTGRGSKALVRLGGLALIERAIRTLLVEGLEQVVVVVGYQAGPVATVATRAAPGRVRTVFAEHWELGNGVSLAAAEPLVAGENVFLLVTTDHVFAENALEPLLSAGRPGVLVDHAPDPDAWDEGTRVRLRAEHAVGFSKDFGDPAIDCGAFLLPAGVFDAQRRAQSGGDPSLAGAVTELARDVPLIAVPLPAGAWWQDVDTPDDLRRASRELRRSLTKETDGPVSRYLHRPMSTRLSMASAHLPIHPDIVSLISFLVAFAGAWALAQGHGVAAAVMIEVASILDGVDGEIARLQVRAGPAGALLDGVLDRISDAAVMAGLAIWAVDIGGSTTAVIALAVAATAGAMLSMATKDRIAALGIPPAPERWISFLMGGRDARLLLVAVAALLGRPALALVAVVVTSAASLAVRLLFTRTTLRGAWPGPR